MRLQTLLGRANHGDAAGKISCFNIRVCTGMRCFIKRSGTGAVHDNQRI